MDSRSFTHTELLILEAKERFDTDMLSRTALSRESKLFLWTEFLKRWHSDLRALSWMHYEMPTESR